MDFTKLPPEILAKIFVDEPFEIAKLGLTNELHGRLLNKMVETVPVYKQIVTTWYPLVTKIPSIMGSEEGLTIFQSNVLWRSLFVRLVDLTLTFDGYNKRVFDDYTDEFFPEFEPNLIKSEITSTVVLDFAFDWVEFDNSRVCIGFSSEMWHAGVIVLERNKFNKLGSYIFDVTQKLGYADSQLDYENNGTVEFYPNNIDDDFLSNFLNHETPVNGSGLESHLPPFN